MCRQEGRLRAMLDPMSPADRGINDEDREAIRWALDRMEILQQQRDGWMLQVFEAALAGRVRSDRLMRGLVMIVENFPAFVGVNAARSEASVNLEEGKTSLFGD